MEWEQPLNQEGRQLNAAFERFLDTGACRGAERDLRALIRAAFAAGWSSARYAALTGEKEPPR